MPLAEQEALVPAEEGLGRPGRCRFCSRRRPPALQGQPAPLRQRLLLDTGSLDASSVCESLAPGSPSGGATRLQDLSDEVMEAVLLCLHGWEALAYLAPAAGSLQRVLQDVSTNQIGSMSSLWKAFLKQEFNILHQSEGSAADVYHRLCLRQWCNMVEWRKVPCTHGLGAREGSPGMFYRHGLVFVFGGWGHGPMGDLHVGLLAVPMCLRQVVISGTAPPRSYEAKITVLAEDEVCSVASNISTGSESGHTEHKKTFRVAVTGGYLHGGYFSESSHYGILEIDCSSPDAVSAHWLRVGEMPAVCSNHSGTFIPSRIAGPCYPDGYLLLFGGNSRGRASNCMALLDLRAWTWDTPHHDMEAGPQARNSHTATLMSSPWGEEGLLVVGGGNGDQMNGGPPRGGRDFCDSSDWAFWLLGLDTQCFTWRNAWTEARLHCLPDDEMPQGAGRGHIAARLEGTDTVVLFGGGKPPTSDAIAFTGGLDSRARVLTVSDASEPAARGFGSGCALPGGIVLVYGGWHPRGGSYRDMWAACFDRSGSNSAFFSQLPITANPQYEQATSDDEEAEGSGDESPPPIFLVQRRLQELLQQERERLGIRQPLLERDNVDVEEVEDTEGEEEEDEEEGDDADEGSSSSAQVASDSSDEDLMDFHF